MAKLRVGREVKPGLPQSEPILARNLLGATPAEAVRLSSVRICSRMVRAPVWRCGVQSCFV
jgi:hypothetical protein